MIPKTLHFIFGLAEDFGGKPFSLVHALAIESAIQVNQPEKAFLHCIYPPRGPWWDRVKSKVELAYIEDDLTNFAGCPLKHYAHKSDVQRLRILLRQGGAYLDLDTISVKELPWTFDSVMGMECDGSGNILGLCNAVILAQRDDAFLAEWLSRYAYFSSREWGHHSVILPLIVDSQMVDLDRPVLRKIHGFHTPSMHHVDELFERVVAFPKSYLHHLWETATWDRYLCVLTPELIRAQDTTYNLIARRFLGGLGL